MHEIQIQDKLQSFFKINIWEIKRNKGIYAYIQVVWLGKNEGSHFIPKSRSSADRRCKLPVGKVDIATEH